MGGMRTMRGLRHVRFVLALGLVALMMPWPAGAQAPTAAPSAVASPAASPAAAGGAMVPARPAGMAGMTGNAVTIRDLGFPDTSITGTLTRQDFYFPGPGQASRTPATMNFSFSHSAQLDPARSAVRVEWNGLAVYTEALAMDSTNKVTRTIQIPADRVQPGLNQASFNFLLLLPNDGPCPEDTNPGRVATVFQDTSVNFGVQVAAVRPDLNIGTFPAAFTQAAESVTRVSVALPGDPTSGELSAASIVAGQIARLAPNNRFNFVTIDPNAQLNPVDTHIVAIGSPQRNPLVNAVAPGLGFNTSGATIISPNGTQNNRETGFLMIGSVPQNPAATALVVTGVSEEGITNASRLFGNTSLLKTINGPFAEAQQVSLPAPREGVARSITLFPQGVQVGRQTDVSQRIVLPPLPETSRVRVNLSVARSPNLNTDLSYLRLTLNGQATGSVQLAGINTQGTPVTLDVPARAFKAGLNTIGFSGSARAPVGQCDSSYANQGGSNVYLNISPTVMLETQEAAVVSPLSLALWPYPLIAQDNRAPTLVTGGDGINAMLNTAAILGPLQDGDVVNFNALRAGPSDPLPPDGNRIIFGTDAQLPYRTALQRELPLALEGNIYTVRNTANATSRVSGSSAPGVIELVGNNRGRTFVVTSTDVAQLDTAVRALSSTLPDTTAVVINQDVVMSANPQQAQSAIAAGQGLRVQALTLPGAQVQTGQARSPLNNLNIIAALLGALAVGICATIGFLGLRRDVA